MAYLSASKAGFYFADVRLVNAVAFSKHFLRFLAISDVKHVLVREFSIPVQKAVVMPALYACVGVVLGLCSYAQMLWVNAGRVIARVQDYAPFRNLSYKKLISVSVRPDWLFSWQQKDPISVIVLRSLPEPAKVGFHNSRFKNILWPKQWKFFKRSSFSASLITTSAQLPSDDFWMPALNAGNHSTALVCHASMICHNNGVGK